MTPHTDPTGFAAHLRTLVEEAVTVFGSRRSGGLIEAFALFRSHLEETVDTSRPGERHMRPDTGGIDTLADPPGQRAQRRQT
ncbi:hypothetical protein [Nocardiopsis sp. MG754419]|uniref:hypothetical protein n=1 Tax=Nocardiopsis sp. MG754419 TaxID=2259865 RepID=UPI002012B1A4|nr:hypothetical protein [Nocardiopsis sp. MG754419]